jgi:hypothetical protein
VVVAKWRPCLGFLLAGLVLWCSVLGQYWSADLLVFGESLASMTAAFYMVEGVMHCTAAKVVIWQAWRASSAATVMEGATSGRCTICY